MHEGLHVSLWRCGWCDFVCRVCLGAQMSLGAQMGPGAQIGPKHPNEPEHSNELKHPNELKHLNVDKCSLSNIVSHRPSSLEAITD